MRNMHPDRVKLLTCCMQVPYTERSSVSVAKGKLLYISFAYRHVVTSRFLLNRRVAPCRLISSQSIGRQNGTSHPDNASSLSLPSSAGALMRHRKNEVDRQSLSAYSMIYTRCIRTPVEGKSGCGFLDTPSCQRTQISRT